MAADDDRDDGDDDDDDYDDFCLSSTFYKGFDVAVLIMEMQNLYMYLWYVGFILR